MAYKILSIIFIFIFYIVRLPIVIIKDIVLAIYSAFDISRFFETYQNSLANLVCASSVLRSSVKHNLDLNDSQSEETEHKTVGFKTCPTGLETAQSPAEAGIIE